MNVLVSACLLGENCKYNGKNNYNEELMQLLKTLPPENIIPICPEEMGGLSTPRDPVELCDGIPQTQAGVSCEKEFRLGTEKVLQLARETGATLAILQSRSPSCGVGRVYDGSFSATLTNGDGYCACQLARNGVRVIDVAKLDLVRAAL